MPIRLNLLAEAKAAEELRRRDPAKRAAMLAVGVVLVVLVWSASLYAMVWVRKSELARLQGEYASRTNAFQTVKSNQKQLAEIQRNLAELRRLATNRFLNGNLLEALQHATVSDVHLSQLKAEQTYLLTPETKARTNQNRLVPGKPAIVAEHVVVTLNARDVGPNPGDQVNQFKEQIAQTPYFLDVLGRTNEITLRNLSAPQPDAALGRSFVQFTLECRYPEKVR